MNITANGKFCIIRYGYIDQRWLLTQIRINFAENLEARKENQKLISEILCQSSSDFRPCMRISYEVSSPVCKIPSVPS